MDFDPASFDQYREILGDEWRVFALDLIDSYLQDAPVMLQTLRSSLEQGDEETFVRTAHTLKSNSRIFGAEGLAGLAGELEARGLDGASEEVEASLPRLETAYAGVSSALISYREEILSGG